MSRLTFGPSQSNVVVALADVPVTITSIVNGTVIINVPAWDAATQQPPSILHVVYLATPPVAGQTPAQVLAAATLTGIIAVRDPGPITVVVSGVPASTYFVQVIPEYAV